MYCPACGEKANEGASFCTKCGSSLKKNEAVGGHGQTNTQPVVSVAIYLKITLFKREPYVLWISPQRSAIICIGQKRFDSLLAGSNREQEAIEQAFRSYALQLAREQLDRILQLHPESIVFNTDEITKLQIIATYDPAMRRFDDYERFILYTLKGRYRGAIERKTSLQQDVATLKTILGSRYTYSTMEQFPFL